MRTSVHALLLGGFLATGAVEAHVPSTAQIVVSVQGRHLSGHWDVALRDLDHAFGIDANKDGTITWGEVRSHAPDLAAYCLSHLVLCAGESPLALECGAMQIDRRSDGVYALLSFSADLPDSSPALRIGYDGFFALDPLHRGVLRFEWDGGWHSAVFSPEDRSHAFRSPGERRGDD